MTTTVFFTFWLIVLARIVDVTLDTIRTVAIVQGRRTFAAALGFVEAVVYISVIAKVLLNTDHPIYVLAYGLGFASGTFLGITIEKRLAFGQQLVAFISHKGVAFTEALRRSGYRVAEVKGHAQDGDLAIVYVQLPRLHTQKLIRDAGAIDDECFCLVNDVRVARFPVRRR